MKKILFYNDTSEFGGHEIMSLSAVKFFITNNYEVYYIHYSGNKKLAKALESLQGIHLVKIEYYSKSLQSVRSFLDIKQKEKLFEILSSINPDIIIAIQGRIESCSILLQISKKLTCSVGTYLPLTHSVKVFSQWPGAWLRDFINLFYYQKPDFFIVPSNAMKVHLQKWTKTKKIYIVHNGLDFERYKKLDPSICRNRLGFSENDFLVSVIGRITFAHKNQKFLLDNVFDLSKKIPNLKILIVGSGIDELRLADVIREKKLESIVTHLPWIDDVSEVLSTTDLLIATSKFEGFPVSVTEGMFYKLPVVAPDIPEISEFLPSEWLYRPEDSKDFVNTVFNLKNLDNNKNIEENFNECLLNYNINKFGEKFEKIVLEVLQKNTS